MMPIKPRSFIQYCRYALLALMALSCFGCTDIDGPWFTETPINPASTVYPTVETGCTCTNQQTPKAWFKRVMIIVLENQNYSDAIANPYLGKLAAEGVSFTNFHGLFHPSYSNYLAMVAGTEVRTFFDGQKNLDKCTVANLLQAKGLSWKNYAQDYPEHPQQCVTTDYFGKYARKHVPFLSFKPIQAHACGNVVAASQFEQDIKQQTLPIYMFYSPNMDNDGHNTGLAYGAKWLESFLEPLRQNVNFMKETLVIVTYDESAEESPANHILTVFLGGMVTPQQVKQSYNHSNVLRTIEENYGLCPLADGDNAAKPITGIWKQAENET